MWVRVEVRDVRDWTKRLRRGRESRGEQEACVALRDVIAAERVAGVGIAMKDSM